MILIVGRGLFCLLYYFYLKIFDSLYRLDDILLINYYVFML